MPVKQPQRSKPQAIRREFSYAAILKHAHDLDRASREGQDRDALESLAEHLLGGVIGDAHVVRVQLVPILPEAPAPRPARKGKR